MGFNYNRQHQTTTDGRILDRDQDTQNCLNLRTLTQSTAEEESNFDGLRFEYRDGSESHTDIGSRLDDPRDYKKKGKKKRCKPK